MAGSSDVTGYNCNNINALRDVINKTAQKAVTEITMSLQDGIVRPMARVWFAPEAVEFFQGVAETVRTTGENITKAFDTFRGAVETAGRNWAENTKGESPSLPAIDPIELSLNVSAIKDSDRGNVTINEAEATNIANQLGEVEQEIKTKLEKIAGDLDAATAFIGRGQAEALQNCFVEVTGEVHKIFKWLTEGEDSLQGQINKAVEKYQEVGTTISDAFNNGI